MMRKQYGRSTPPDPASGCATREASPQYCRSHDAWSIQFGSSYTGDVGGPMFVAGCKPPISMAERRPTAIATSYRRMLEVRSSVGYEGRSIWPIGS